MKYIVPIVMLAVIISCQSEKDDPSVDCNTYDLMITVSSTTDANCGNADGSVSVDASGGDGNYTFTLNGGNQNSDGEFTGIAAGVYTVTVKDGSPCSANITATVNNVDGAQFDQVNLTDAGCNTQNGTISVSGMEGAPPYRYALNDNAFQEDPTFTGLGAGDYTVRLIDDNDCETTQEVKVLHGTSWSLEVEEIINGNCALPTCHGGTQSPDFRDFENVVNNAANIKARTGNGTMPPNAVLDPDDVQAIACWVDDGARDN